MRQRARRDEASLWEAALAELATDSLAGRAKNALRAFLQLIEDLARDCLVPRRPAKPRTPAPLARAQIAGSRFAEMTRSRDVDDALASDSDADEPLPLAEQIEHAIARSGLRDFYERTAAAAPNRASRTSTS